MQRKRGKRRRRGRRRKRGKRRALPLQWHGPLRQYGDPRRLQGGVVLEEHQQPGPHLAEHTQHIIAVMQHMSRVRCIHVM